MENWRKNFEKINNANKNHGQRTISFTSKEKIAFIKKCEKIFGIKSDDFLIAFEKDNIDKSPDIKRWYRYIKELNEKKDT